MTWLPLSLLPHQELNAQLSSAVIRGWIWHYVPTTQVSWVPKLCLAFLLEQKQDTGLLLIALRAKLFSVGGAPGESHSDNVWAPVPLRGLLHLLRGQGSNPCYVTAAEFPRKITFLSILGKSTGNGLLDILGRIYTRGNNQRHLNELFKVR